jgi:hypothetical protein
MNLGDISNIISFILSDRKPDLVVTAGEFERILHLCQLKQFKRKIGLPEEYQPGSAVPAQVYEISKVITDDLAPFKVIMGGDNPPLTLDDKGEAYLPEDFFYPSALTYKYIKTTGEIVPREVELLSDKEYNKRLASFVKRPSLKFPVGNIYGNKVRFYPYTLKFVDMIYLRVPPKPVYGSSYGKGYQRYDSATSTELLWNDVNIIDIISLFMNELGINIPSADLISYSNQNKQTGI